MPGEKEININLFDQLTLIERIERLVKKGDLKAVEEEIEILKNETTLVYSLHYKL